MSTHSSSFDQEKQRLDSKKYRFSADGTMPVLEIDITAGRAFPESRVAERLTIELYNPMSGEIFEAKFSKGRLEVDNDGSVTYFTTSSDHVNLSLFCGRNLSISMTRGGEVVIKSPSRIVSVDQDLKSRNRQDEDEVTSDSIRLRLE